jgi:hypothetical protein
MRSSRRYRSPVRSGEMATLIAEKSLASTKTATPSPPTQARCRGRSVSPERHGAQSLIRDVAHPDERMQASGSVGCLDRTVLGPAGREERCCGAAVLGNSLQLDRRVASPPAARAMTRRGERVAVEEGEAAARTGQVGHGSPPHSNHRDAPGSSGRLPRPPKPARCAWATADAAQLTRVNAV